MRRFEHLQKIAKKFDEEEKPFVQPCIREKRKRNLNYENIKFIGKETAKEAARFSK